MERRTVNVAIDLVFTQPMLLHQHPFCLCLHLLAVRDILGTHPDHRFSDKNLLFGMR